MKKKNKLKVLSYALMLSLSASSLTGCSKNFSYENDENGKVVVEGTIDYDRLKNYSLIELKLLNGENKLYIVNKESWHRGAYVTCYEYKDVFTGENVYFEAISDVTDECATDMNINLVNEYLLEEYLITYDEVKTNYNIDDVKRLYDKIVEDYEFENTKQLKK